MSLASVAIRNPVFAWMLMAGFIVFGLISFNRLPQGQYPDIDFPIITVNATLEGAAPETMESDVVDVLEDAIMAVEGIRELSSSSKLGSATITIEFELNRDIDVALQDVQARVTQAAKLLPTDMDPVVLRKSNPEESPIMWIAFSGTRDPQSLADYANNVLRDRFLTVEGDGDVTMGGFLARNVRIWLDHKALEAYGLSADDVIGAVQAQHVEVPGGRLEGATREANVMIEGEAMSMDEWRNLLVASRNGTPVYLKDVGLVENGFEDVRRIARSNGLPTVGLGIIKQHGANTVDVANAVHERIRELRRTMPAGLALNVRVDTSKFIKDAVHEIEFTLFMAVTLTALVCWLFLGSLSSTLNVVLAIPVSVCGTFALMYFAGFSLNTFTLLALSLSVGIVVDDAVMVLENIYRHAEMGKDKVRAAREGAEQISFAALAATLAVIAIFLPVAFMTGIIGKFFFQFGVVLSVAVAISLLEALTLAPSRCSQFLRVGQRENVIERTAGRAFGALAAAYRWCLRGILGMRSAVLARIILPLLIIGALALLALLAWAGYGAVQSAAWLGLGFIVLGFAGTLFTCGYFVLSLFRPNDAPLGALIILVCAGAVFALSLALIPMLPKEMIPSQDQGFYLLRITTPVGSSIEYTDGVMKGVEKLFVGHSEMDSNMVVVGSGDANAGMVFVTLKPPDERHAAQKQALTEYRKTLDAQQLTNAERTAKLAEFKFRHPATQQESMALFRKELQENPFPGSRVVLVDPSQTGFASSRRGGLSIEYSVRGPDWDTLGDLSEKIMEDMRSSGVFTDVDTDYRKGMPEIQVFPDREKALAQNVDMLTLANTVGALVGGSKIARYKDNGRRYDVRVRMLKDDRSRLEDIGKVYIRAKDGKLVRLSDVATITTHPSLQSISRINRARAVTMMANPASGHSQAEALDYIEKMKLPDGYSVYFSGSSRAFRESFDSLMFALVLGLVVAYMVLASQFNSFLHPFTVLLALPFSVSGALISLSASGQSLNIYSVIGIILLMGIVKKNSILLVDYTNQLREEGKSCDDALKEACPVRLRPILMTSVATVAGALPAALALGPGGELLIPMATAIIGGVMLSTLLTLFVVPSFYSVADQVRTALAGRMGFSAAPAPVLLAQTEEAAINEI